MGEALVEPGKERWDVVGERGRPVRQELWISSYARGWLEASSLEIEDESSHVRFGQPGWNAAAGRTHTRAPPFDISVVQPPQLLYAHIPPSNMVLVERC